MQKSDVTAFFDEATNTVGYVVADPATHACAIVDSVRDDDPAAGREDFRRETSVAEERAQNIHVHDGITDDAFGAMRESRDAQLGMPGLIVPSVQINMRTGRMPPPADNGRRYIKIPLNAL